MCVRVRAHPSVSLSPGESVSHACQSVTPCISVRACQSVPLSPGDVRIYEMRALERVRQSVWIP